ncbi:MAG: hypothetical protein LUQ24_06265 [Methanobacterium sp.]|jgi:hypothetical protein|nr:hypothetical protein [Methanobacterium sp.]
MPDLGPMGRGGARRRTRRRMSMMNEMEKSRDEPESASEPDEVVATDVYSEKLEKLAKLLVDKGVITETEYNLIFD